MTNDKLEAIRKRAEHWPRSIGQASEDIDALLSHIAALEAEHEGLAANQCLVSGGIVGDEGGTPYCTLAALEAAHEAEMLGVVHWIMTAEPMFDLDDGAAKILAAYRAQKEMEL